jgi:hypothetical protein
MPGDVFAIFSLQMSFLLQIDVVLPVTGAAQYTVIGAEP